MPRVSTFHGIVISMYFNDHSPPHFHAIYGGREAKILISNGEVLEGSLPRHVLRLVQKWATLHRRELQVDWKRARAGLPLGIIEPLS